MSIREVRQGVWQARVYIGMEGTRERFAYLTIHGKRADALAAERKLALKKGSKSRLGAYNMSIAEFLIGWLEEYVAPYRAEKTLKNHEMHIKNRIIPAIGRIELRKLTPQDIQRFYNKTAGERIDGKLKPVSMSTINGTHRVLHAALERAVKLDLIDFNPSDRVEAPQPARFQPRVLTPEEAIKFLDAAKSSRHRTLVTLALFTGLRLGEMLALRWENVDLKEGIIKVIKSKTKAGERLVPLPPVAIALLQEQRSATKGDLVFPGKWKGQEVELSYLSYRVIDRICKRAGLPHMRFHDLRHTHATWLAASDISARTVADRLGHSDAAFTLRTYAHASLTAQKKAAALVGDILTDYKP